MKNRIIFIFGITQRCGTNYLSDLLEMHPDCVASPLPVPECYCLRHSDLLVRYAGSLSRFWSSVWQAPDWDDRLCYALGEGLIQLITQNYSNKAVVVKTPSVGNLDHFHKLFPHERAVLLIRDGRAVVESAARTFHASRELMTRLWAYNARRIQQIVHEDKGRHFLVIKYEDLVENLDKNMRTILEFFDLNVGNYDFQAATSAPIRGSSELAQKGGAFIGSPYPDGENSAQPGVSSIGPMRSIAVSTGWPALRRLSFGYELHKNERKYLDVFMHRLRDILWQVHPDPWPEEIATHPKHVVKAEGERA